MMIEIAPGLWDLGEYRPVSLDEKDDGTSGPGFWYFISWVQTIVPNVYTGQMRGPATHMRFAPSADVFDWHQDCGGTHDGMLFVWADKLPTEVREVKTWRKVELKPYHVYALDNNKYEHRTPPAVLQDRNRWFARAYVTRERWKSDRRNQPKV